MLHRFSQADALGQFGSLPKGVDLIVMDQQKGAVVPSSASDGDESAEGGGVSFLVRGVGQVAVAVPMDICPSEFEDAVSDQAAARHAYFDDLEAAILMMPALYQTAVDRQDYDAAPKFLAMRAIMQSILSSGISKPRSKLAIKAALDAGVLLRIEELTLDAANFLQLTECLAEKSDVENQIAAAKRSAALNTAQLLAQEKAAVARQDFATAGQLKAAKEASIQSGQRDVAQLRVCNPVQMCPRSITRTAHAMCIRMLISNVDAGSFTCNSAARGQVVDQESVVERASRCHHQPPPTAHVSLLI
jgi:hypothetical protein